MSERGFASIDYANADLYNGLNSRPPSAIPLEIPMKNLQPKPDGSPPIVSPGEKALMYEEQAALREGFRQEQLRNQAREQEIYNREQAQRNELAQRTKPAQTPEPRVTNKNPDWENPTPSKPRGLPAPATPPPTPNTSGARTPVLVDIQQPPPPAYPKQSLPAQNPTPTAQPSGLPIPAGLVGSAVGGGIVSGAFRIIAGQSPGQALVGGIGTGAGTAVGAVVGSFAGPVGTFVGGAIGGYVGGAAADLLWNTAFPPTVGTKPRLYEAPAPFSGGQGTRVRYSVKARWSTYFLGRPGDEQVLDTNNVYGPIEAIYLHNIPDASNGAPGVTVVAYNHLGQKERYQQGNGYYPATEPYNLRDISIVRVDGLPDTAGDPPAPALPADNRTPNSVYHPGNTIYAPPHAIPSTSNNPAPNNYAPGGISSGGLPRGDAQDWVPHFGLAPRLNPNPTATPSNLGGNFPDVGSLNPEINIETNPGINTGINNSKVPESNSSIGNNSPFPRSITGFSPGTLGSSNAQPIPFGGSTNIASTTTFTPNPLPTSAKQPIFSDGFKSQSPGQPNQNQITPQPNEDKKFDELLKQVQNQGAALAIITAILNGIPNKKEVEDTVKAGVCSTLQPGACGNKAIEEAANNINNNTNNKTNNVLDAVNTGANAAQLALLQVIDNKLGPQLPGGLSGKLQRFSKWLQLDRLLNILTWVNTLHNAYMLSSSLSDTLFSIVDNVVNIFMKDDDGEDVNARSFFGKAIDDFAKGIFGVETWTGIKVTWAKWNRIYQAGANIFNSMRNMLDSARNIQEWTAENTGRIGNALKRFGVVGDKAFKWMPENVNAQSKWQQRLENLQEAAEGIEMITSEVISIQDNLKEIQEQKEVFVKSLENSVPKQEKDNKKVSEIKTTEKTASQSQPINDENKEVDE